MSDRDMKDLLEAITKMWGHELILYNEPVGEPSDAMFCVGTYDGKYIYIRK